jgi:hypothetical protein
MPICSEELYINKNVYKNEGVIPNEIDTNFSCLGDGEKNSVWYMINIQTEGKLGFTIIPFDPEDDYDWAVYNITNTSCAGIKTNPEIEVSCNNFNLFDPANAWLNSNGETGPNGKSGLNKQGKIGSPFNRRLDVKKGEIYVIVVSSWYYEGQDGYSIDFSASSMGLFD